MPRSIDDISKVIDAYHAYLLLEKGLADNTRISYDEDVKKYLNYLADNNLILRDTTPDTLQSFLADLHDIGIAVSTQARIISGLKSFFKFLKMEGYLDENPSLLLQSPKLGRHLPDVLSIDEIDEMISCVDMSAPEGQRNRAIMETLYGCGCG